MDTFANEAIGALKTIPLNIPVLWISLMFIFFTFGFSFRFVSELSEALETIGITIQKEDRKKWRKLFRTLLLTAYCIFLLFYYTSAFFLR